MTLLARGLVALSPLTFLAALSVQAPSRSHELRVAYYQPFKDAKTTICVDTFGEVVLYPGLLRKKGALSPDTFSVCLESPKTLDQAAEIMDDVAVVHRFGALGR